MKKSIAKKKRMGFKSSSLLPRDKIVARDLACQVKSVREGINEYKLFSKSLLDENVDAILSVPQPSMGR
ncbi:MAG: hypothetical protein DDT19_00661 [Syntrophomonadaceae bacterium]|nr:hypothetical protein [Bacillota bacterium]